MSIALQSQTSNQLVGPAHSLYVCVATWAPHDRPLPTSPAFTHSMLCRPCHVSFLLVLQMLFAPLNHLLHITGPSVWKVSSLYLRSGQVFSLANSYSQEVHGIPQRVNEESSVEGLGGKVGGVRGTNKAW